MTTYESNKATGCTNTTSSNKSWGSTSSSAASTGTATCSETTPGTTYTVNDITSPGCYVCNWNGSLLRVNDNCFDSSNNTYFSFSSNETLTVTFLTENPYASIGECRQIATSSNVSSNF